MKLLCKKSPIDYLPTALQEGVIVEYDMYFTSDYQHSKKIADYIKIEKDSWWEKQAGWSYHRSEGYFPEEIKYLTKYLLPRLDKNYENVGKTLNVSPIVTFF